jgi:hypothetical protein
MQATLSRRAFARRTYESLQVDVMSDGSGSFDFPAILFALYRACCVSVRSFLVRNWCGSLCW